MYGKIVAIVNAGGGMSQTIQTHASAKPDATVSRPTSLSKQAEFGQKVEE